MLAIFGGALALLLGLLLLLLPLLVSELSRPRDSVWGAVVLMLGLVLVTSADRLTGAPMLGVLCGGLLIGRLGLEVGQGRWRALSDAERQELGSPERWQRAFDQLQASLVALVQALKQSSAGLLAWWEERRSKPAVVKRWVRAEEAPPHDPALEPLAAEDASAQDAPAEMGPTEVGPAEEPAAQDRPVAGPLASQAPADERPAADPGDGPPSLQDPEVSPDPGLRQVSDFGVIEELLSQAPPAEARQEQLPAPQTPAEAAAGEAG